jgi:hypothetical protein
MVHRSYGFHLPAPKRLKLVHIFPVARINLTIINSPAPDMSGPGLPL